MDVFNSDVECCDVDGVLHYGLQTLLDEVSTMVQRRDQLTEMWLLKLAISIALRPASPSVGYRRSGTSTVRQLSEIMFIEHMCSATTCNTVSVPNGSKWIRAPSRQLS